MSQHGRDEVLSLLKQANVGAVATSAGDRIRNRMMHFAVDDDFTVYLATMKGDPKTIQMTRHPSTSILVHRTAEDINESREVEITGTALTVIDPEERQRALEMVAQKSPVVKYLCETGNAAALDCIKVAAETVKYRVFGEIVQGMPPAVFDFPENRLVVSDWYLIKRKARNWWTALRFPFLSASIVPILLGTAIGWSQTGTMLWGYFLLALVAGVLLHAGTNIINDYFDHKSGNDELNTEFVRPFSGGSRVIQSGLLSPMEVLLGSLFLFLIASGIGGYLAWALGWPILALGAAGAISGIFYTGRPFNWGSRGIGEALVGVNLGLLMTLGAYYVQTSALSWVPVVAAAPLALLISAVLLVNEFPDYSADKAVGKNTLVVRLGQKRAAILYTVIMVGSYVALGAGVASGLLPLVALVALITVPISLRAVLYARKYHSSSFDLVPANALTINTHLTTGLLLTLAYAWAGWGTHGLGYLVGVGLAAAGFAAYMYWYVERQKNIFFSLKQALR